MKELRGRVAVVTGAASGIGRAVAERFAAEGMKVVLADVESKALSAFECELRMQGFSALAVETDVSKWESVEALRQRVMDTFGTVHVLCNNAGVNSPEGLLWERTISDWQWVLGVNLWGVVHGIRAFLPAMLESGVEGHIVNTASRDGFVAGPLLGVYRASKHAVVSLSESLYFELAMKRSKIGVSILCPGVVQTRIRSSERNRPGHSPDGKVGSLHSDDGTSRNGILPSEVAAHVVDALRANQFYIFVAKPEEMVHVKARSEWILEQRNPTFLETREERLKRLRQHALV